MFVLAGDGVHFTMCLHSLLYQESERGAIVYGRPSAVSWAIFGMTSNSGCGLVHVVSIAKMAA